MTPPAVNPKMDSCNRGRIKPQPRSQVRAREKNEMRAYHDDQAVKAKYIGRVRTHREADNLIQGTGWENGKGCAVGCTLESYDHAAYEAELGVPRMLAHLEDAIFEGLAEAEAQAWPERFLKAIPVGADLSLVGWQYLDWLLSDLPETDDSDSVVWRVRDEVTGPMSRGEEVDLSVAKDAAWAAERAARSAARSARSAAWAAERAARSAAWAARPAESAAESAAARWAESAAGAAARAAERSAWAAARAADSVAAWNRQADKLIDLLEAAQ